MRLISLLLCTTSISASTLVPKSFRRAGKQSAVVGRRDRSYTAGALSPTRTSGTVTDWISALTNAAETSIVGNKFHNVALLSLPRGGESCSDSDLIVLTKMLIMAVFETAGLVGIIASGLSLSKSAEWAKQLPQLFGLPLIQFSALAFVVFNSSFVSAFLEGGMSAATNQVLMPNVVPGDPDWYANLNKPSWNPPGWLFPIMWVIISKPTQLLALRQLLISTESTATPWKALTVYCAHLALGDSWNKVFFGCQRIQLGAAVITSFFALLLLSAILFREIDVVAGNFMLPTCGWVFVASSLNYAILRLNPGKK